MLEDSFGPYLPFSHFYNLLPQLCQCFRPSHLHYEGQGAAQELATFVLREYYSCLSTIYMVLYFSEGQLEVYLVELVRIVRESSAKPLLSVVMLLPCSQHLPGKVGCIKTFDVLS